MSENNRHQIEKAQMFINQVMDLLDKFLEDVDAIKKGEKKKPSLELFSQMFDQIILNNIIESYLDLEENTKIPDYDLIPLFFHEFIKIYTNDQEKILNIFKKNEISFNWIYNRFTKLNSKSDHFKLRFETIDLLIKNLDNCTLEVNWIDTDFLKKNYLELLETDEEYFFKLKTLILMILRFQKRKILDIKA